METNSLIYKTSKVKSGKVYYITIRLNDECKNGHQDFHISADVYESGKPKTDRYWLGSGTGFVRDLNLPEFQIFLDLDNCDYLGNPMYATVNGYYYLKSGLPNCPANSEAFPAVFCSYYRLPLECWDTLKNACSEVHYALLLIDLKVPALWKSQADIAIKKLEGLTGNTFVVDSVRNQFGMPSDDKILLEKEKIASGYYDLSAKNARRESENNAFIDKLKTEYKSKVEAVNLELEIKLELFRLGGKRLLDSALWYTHSQTLGFNWRGYGEKLQESEIIGCIEQSPVLSGLKYTVK